MKMSKNVSVKLFAVAALLEYIAAILNFFVSRNDSSVVMNVILGSLFISCSVIFRNKNESEDDKKED